MKTPDDVFAAIEKGCTGAAKAAIGSGYVHDYYRNFAADFIGVAEGAWHAGYKAGAWADEPAVDPGELKRLRKALDDMWACIASEQIDNLEPGTLDVARANHKALWHEEG